MRAISNPLRVCLRPFALACLAAPGAAAEPPQEHMPNQNWPVVTLANASIRLTACLPDATSGFYRGVRFDRSSMLDDIDVAGHRFFARHRAGPHNPFGHDDATGPAEEFDLEGNPPGYEAAGPGAVFVKIGVGALLRPSAKAYSFARAYTLVDPGVWQVSTAGSTSATFRHTLGISAGWAYIFERRVVLPADGSPRLSIERSLRNTGTQPLRTLHYSHNFMQIDGHPIGSACALELPFTPQAVSPMPEFVRLDGRMVRFVPQKVGKTVWVRLSGFGSTSADNAATFRHLPSGAAVSFATDRPPADFRFYGNGRIFCPEAFTLIALEPGESATWSTEIRFTAPTQQEQGPR
jgi:hypothetical protein